MALVAGVGAFWRAPLYADEEGAEFSGAIIEPLRVHHAARVPLPSAASVATAPVAAAMPTSTVATTTVSTAMPTSTVATTAVATARVPGTDVACAARTAMA